MKEIDNKGILLGFNGNNKTKNNVSIDKELKPSQEFSLRLNDNLCISTTCSVTVIEKIFKPYVMSKILDSFLCPKVFIFKVDPEWYNRSLLSLSEKTSKSSLKELFDLKELLSEEHSLHEMIRFKRFSSSFC